MSAKYTYELQSFYHGEWRRLFKETRDFCLGYLQAKQYEGPRNALRIVRSDGAVMEKRDAKEEVAIGMVASYPTPEQYEYAAAIALNRAKAIRHHEAQRAMKLT